MSCFIVGQLFLLTYSPFQIYANAINKYQKNNKN